MGPRRRRVVWSEGASRELDEATGYVAEESLRRAIRLLERLLDAAEALADLSERGSFPNAVTLEFVRCSSIHTV